MAERAFNAYPHEVRAIQAGLQTQFRRVVKPQKFVFDDNWIGGGYWERKSPSIIDPVPERISLRDVALRCPYGQPGDKLWLREAHEFNTANAQGVLQCYYKADGALRDMFDAPYTPPLDRGRTSSAMPRWASRITLGVTGVRVERLGDISKADAIAEGIGTIQVSESDERWVNYCDPDYSKAAAFGDPRRSYWSLFESLYGPTILKANPWVWVVSFKRVEPRNA